MIPVKGTPVRFWPGWRTGPAKIGRLASADPTIIGGTECLYVQGHGAIALGHIEMLDFSHGVIEVATVEEAVQAAAWDDVLTVNVTDEDERAKIRKVVVKLA